MSAVSGMLRFLVVAAAGAGAWFGYDAFVEAREAEPTPLETGVSSPWAELDLIVAGDTRTGPVRTTVLSAEGVPLRTFDFDSTRIRSIETEYDETGTVVALAEIDADEAYLRRPGDEWLNGNEEPDIAGGYRSRAMLSLPVTLGDVVGPEVWPYSRVVGERIGGEATSPTRILTIRMKGGAFTNADPSGAAQWRVNNGYPNVGGRVEIDVEIDATGHVVAIEFLAPGGNRYEFEPLASEPVFAAPFTT